MSEREQMLGEPSMQPALHPLSSVESRVPAGLVTLLFIVALATLLGRNYVHSGESITLKVNGATWSVHTHQRSVGALLREVGLDLCPQDVVMPLLGTSLDEQPEITVRKALPMLIEADGRKLEHHTHCTTVLDVLLETGFSPEPHDVVKLDGKVVELDATLPNYAWAPSRWPLLRGLVQRLRSVPVPHWCRLQLQRALLLTISDGGTQLAIYTTARTVGEALLGEDIVLYAGDRVRPLLGTLLTAGMRLQIDRATPVTIEADGRNLETRTQGRSVVQLLSEAGIELLNRDYVVPALETQIVPGMTVKVVRVVEAWMWESEEMPFQTVWRPDSALELDQYRTDQPGQPGVRKRRVSMTYEDGEEKTRVVTDDWVERQPTTHLASYGTKIVIRELETADAVVRYWRKVRMLATSYSPSTAGKALDHPQFGITRLGWQAAKGVVAVDPRAINLRTEVYVPGYGFGTAADTGGKIKGRRIDLCYDDDNLVLWKSWVDVYLLDPAPPADQINWRLPDYPVERR